MTANAVEEIRISLNSDAFRDIEDYLDWKDAVVELDNRRLREKFIRNNELERRIKQLESAMANSRLAPSSSKKATSTPAQPPGTRRPPAPPVRR